MILASKVSRTPEEFESVIRCADANLQEKAAREMNYFPQRGAVEFEIDVYESLQMASKNTPFEGKIELISGHKFPDIVVGKSFGVEVKTTKSNKWRSTGNSIFESTRIDGVRDIFIYFAQLKTPAKFMYKRYEDCLADIAVTHSPRYLIDMEVTQENTIFSRMDISYEMFRALPNPVEKFIDFVRSNMAAGEEPWWINGEDTPILNPTVRLFSNLNEAAQKDLRIRAMILFPEVFGRSSTKFQRVATWLVTRHGVVDSSLRDRFSAGGQVEIKTKRSEYRNIPRIFLHLQSYIGEIVQYLESQDCDKQELKYYWKGYDTGQSSLSQWVKRFLPFAASYEMPVPICLLDIVGGRYPGPKPQFLREVETRYGLN